MMSNMLWPSAPTCHKTDSEMFHFVSATSWRAPEPAREPSGTPFRTCSYCGSISAEDLVAFSREVTISFDEADWKYGWPHKFYVEGIPNPQAGKSVRVGTSSKSAFAGAPFVEEPIMGTGAVSTFAKWYNIHLLDEGYDYDSFAAVTDLLKQKSGIEFSRDAGKLLFKRV